MAEKDNVIVYKGSEIEKRIPGLLQMIALDDVAVELRKLNTHFKKTEFEGSTTSKTLNATNQDQHVKIEGGEPPWIAVSFLNQGPNNAMVKINENGDWIPLFVNIPQNVDFTGANEKICRIHFICNVTGGTAVIAAVGKY